MQTKDFHFELPGELIAQTPIDSRDKSRLLCMPRASEEANLAADSAFEHRYFYQLPGLLHKGDCLVLNDSRVLPARLHGTRDTGGAVEVLLLKEAGTEKEPAEEPVSSHPANMWECLVRPGKKMKPGTKLIFGGGALTATVNSVMENGSRLIEFRCGGNFSEMLDKLGEMPLPPYITHRLQDAERYQTVYSQKPGSAAAPTAGLHFTRKLLDEISARGVKVCHITLHIGPGTFRPVKTEKIEDHVMHSEYYEIPRQTAQIINETKEKCGRVIAIGTTACRTLESACLDDGTVTAAAGETGIFIYPGYQFKCIDGLITNFHLPGSTLIMLVAAFAGYEQTMAAYKEAIAERYRFYSFGDAMLIL